MIENYYSVINQKSYDTLINQLKLKNNYIEIIENLDDELMKNYLLDKLG